MVVVFGSINLDLIFGLPKIPAAGETILGPSTRIEPGGKGANQAVAAARDGASVLMAGAIGGDALGAGALALLRDAGVDLDRVETVEASTGCAAIAVDPAGNNAISVGSGANLSARAAIVEDAVLGPDATLVLQMEVATTETAALIARARALGTRIVLNLAPAEALPEAALRAVDVLVVNESEGAWLADHLLCGTAAQALADRLGVTVVLTRGGEGADVAGPDGAGPDGAWHEPPVPVEAIDTTAAGDCFVGVMASRLDRGDLLRDAIHRAAGAAALCCTRRGSQGSIPLEADTDAFVRARRPPGQDDDRPLAVPHTDTNPDRRRKQNGHA